VVGVLKGREAQMVTAAMGAAMKGLCISYGKKGLNMAAKDSICASLLFGALGVGKLWNLKP